MDIYHFSRTTGEYLKKGTAPLDPEETRKQGRKVYLLPACATFDPPPETGANETARMTQAGKWEKAADYRGTRYWLEDGTEKVVRNLGERIPKGALDTPPALPPLTEQEVNEQKIRQEMRALAVSSLKAKGELPADFQLDAGARISGG